MTCPTHNLAYTRSARASTSPRSIGFCVIWDVLVRVRVYNLALGISSEVAIYMSPCCYCEFSVRGMRPLQKHDKGTLADARWAMGQSQVGQNRARRLSPPPRRHDPRLDVVGLADLLIPAFESQGRAIWP